MTSGFTLEERAPGQAEEPDLRDKGIEGVVVFSITDFEISCTGEAFSTIGLEPAYDYCRNASPLRLLPMEFFGCRVKRGAVGRD